MDIVLIGSGNVATQLGKALRDEGQRILQVYSRTLRHAEQLSNELSAETMATDTIAKLDRGADYYFICTTDQSIPEIVRQLPPDLKGIIVHTSGSTSIAVFADYPAAHGVFYPVQTFSKSKELSFSQIPIGLEASDSESYRALETLGKTISNIVFTCDSVQRQSIHLAAVFACNFTNYLYATAENILKQQGLDFDLIRPLITETANKALLFSPHTVQTGPASRGDTAVLAQHIHFLETSFPSHPRMKEIYTIISSLIMSDERKEI